MEHFAAALVEWVLSNDDLDVEPRAAAHFRHAIALMGVGDHELATSSALAGRGMLNCGAPTKAALHGALSLCAAVGLARAYSSQPIDRRRWSETIVHYLRDADKDVVLAGDAPDRWHLEFNVANVAAHRVAVFAEMGDYDAAQATFDEADLSGLSDERRARVAGDLERAKAATALRDGTP
jgi:hypothetical protein